MSADPAASGGSLRRQLIQLSAGVTAVAAVVLTLVVQLVLSQITSSSLGSVLTDRCDAVIASIQDASGGGRLVVPDASLVAGVAVYDDTGTLVAGGAPAAIADVYAELATTGSDSSETTVTREVRDTDQVQAQPFVLDDGTRGVVVATERIEPFEEAERAALIVSLVTGALAVAASALLAAWVSRRALHPVVQMATTASAWSERDLGRRFDLGPPTNEITALAGTLDGLLDKVATAIRSEQRLTSELAHELRTPLTAVQGTAGLLLMRPDLDPAIREDLDEILAGTKRMADTISGLLDLARSSSNVTAASVSPLHEVLERATEQAATMQTTTVRFDATDVILGLPENLALRAIGPIIDNAVRLAEHVTVTVAPGRPGFVDVCIDDDGPGVAPSQADAIFEAGFTAGDHAGTGLGLALSRRVARSVGGDVRFEPRDVGSRFVVELPHD